MTPEKLTPIAELGGRTMADVEREYAEMLDKIRRDQKQQEQLAQGVPRVIRRQMYKTRDPNTRRARKELNRMKRAAQSHGVNLG